MKKLIMAVLFLSLVFGLTASRVLAEKLLPAENKCAAAVCQPKTCNH